MPTPRGYPSSGRPATDLKPPPTGPAPGAPTKGPAMTDNPRTSWTRIQQAQQRLTDLASLLAAHAREDLAGLVAPTASLEARISGSSSWEIEGDHVPATGVERYALERTQTAPAASRIVRSFERAIRTLEQLYEDLHPQPSGPCRTQGCQRDGLTNYDGRCVKCGPWMRRNPGFTPDQVHSLDEHKRPIPGRTLVDDWNDQRRRECFCKAWACDDHTDGDCFRESKPGRNQCDTCRQRESRARGGAA